MMSFAHILKEIRKTKNMTQRSLALEVGIDQSRISAYEAGEEIPNDIALNIIKVLNSPRLSLAFSDLRKSEVINIPTPTNINDDVVNVLDVVIEEAEELIVAGAALKRIIRNKKCEGDFTDIEMDEVLKLEEQIADLIPCLRIHFIRMAECFNLDISRLESRMFYKFKSKNLIN
jgi:transcriptional regulator with XRE-family HTH domain